MVNLVSVNLTISQLSLGVFAEMIGNIYTIYLVCIFINVQRVYVNLYVV